MQETEKLANFVVKAKIGEMPPQAIEVAKEAMLDCLGCIFTGAVQPVGKIITEYIREVGAKSVSTVIAQGLRTSPDLAALANGIMAHAEDYDDISLSVLGHPSAPLFPAILAAGEQRQVSGQELVEAYIVGFEVAARLGLTLGLSHYDRGWHGTATTGTVASAAAAARLFNLDSEKVRIAMAIAASQTAGLRQNFGTMTKPFHPGNAAKSGVMAALLAEKGFTADLNIIEAPLGFLSVYRGQEMNPLETITEKLGEDFEIAKTGIAFKPYPSCGETHAGIEIMLAMKREHKILPEDVRCIECVFNETMNSVMLHHDPKTGLEGKFSIEYCVARALLDGTVKLADFTGARVNQPEIREIIKKVRIHIDSSLPMMATIINLELTGGRKLSKRINKPKGWPENPLTDEGLAAKYRDCAGLVLAAGEIEQTLELMGDLEKVKDITKLIDIIVKNNR